MWQRISRWQNHEHVQHRLYLFEKYSFIVKSETVLEIDIFLMPSLINNCDWTIFNRNYADTELIFKSHLINIYSFL